MIRCRVSTTHRRALAAAMKTLEPEPPLKRAALSGRVSRYFDWVIKQHEYSCAICNGAPREDQGLHKLQRERIIDEKPDTSVADALVTAYLQEMRSAGGEALHGIVGAESYESAPGASALREIA
jgi:hypothetical protein